MTATFTTWHRSMGDDDLYLAVEHDGRFVECVELDVSELPNRPDLLARLGSIARECLLAETRAQPPDPID